MRRSAALALTVASDFEIFVMNADGSSPRQVTHNRTGDFDPGWSPDGQSLR
jgi:Tol biopolymer transport system component